MNVINDIEDTTKYSKAAMVLLRISVSDMNNGDVSLQSNNPQIHSAVMYTVYKVRMFLYHLAISALEGKPTVLRLVVHHRVQV